MVDAALVAFVKHIAYVSTVSKVLISLTLLTQATLDNIRFLWENERFDAIYTNLV